LYWVLIRNEIENAIYGFSRDAEESDEWIPEDERQYSELRWGKYKSTQTVHYLHGALQLFDTGVEVIKEEYTAPGKEITILNMAYMKSQAYLNIK